jgi:ferric-dicitrate binding protein FerR (iron transport regulator)
MMAQWDNRIQAYLEGSAEPGDVEALDGRLRSDAAVRREFLLAAGMEWQLTRVLSVAETAAAMDPGPAEPVLATLFRAREGAAERRRDGGRRRSAFRGVGIPLALAAGVALVFWLAPRVHFRNGKGGVLEASGRVELVRRAERILIEPGSSRALESGDEIKTGPDGTAAIRYADGSILRLSPNAEVRLQSVSDRKRADLRIGSLGAWVRPQREDQGMRLTTSLIDVEVVGTVLRLRTNSDSSELDVVEGSVRMTRTADGKSRAVSAGESVTVWKAAGTEMRIDSAPATAPKTQLLPPKRLAVPRKLRQR